jgi:hypothetical protein
MNPDGQINLIEYPPEQDGDYCNAHIIQTNALTQCLKGQYTSDEAVDRLIRAAAFTIQRHEELQPAPGNDNLNTYGIAELKCAIAAFDTPPQSRKPRYPDEVVERLRVAAQKILHWVPEIFYSLAGGGKEMTAKRDQATANIDELELALAALQPEACRPQFDLVGGKLWPICETCDGTGRIPPTYTCNPCPGNGLSAHDLTKLCPDCDGSGRINDKSKPKDVRT